MSIGMMLKGGLAGANALVNAFAKIMRPSQGYATQANWSGNGLANVGGGYIDLNRNKPDIMKRGQMQNEANKKIAETVANIFTGGKANIFGDMIGAGADDNMLENENFDGYGTFGNYANNLFNKQGFGSNANLLKMKGIFG